jgi:hypothetical protein
VSEFVEVCRREWQRLGVPDPVANEMAADLTADLEEARAEGGSPEDVLGNSAFDPCGFAAAWAIARGVTAPPNLGRSSSWRPHPWRPSTAGVLTVLLGLLTFAAGLDLLLGLRRSSMAMATHEKVVSGPGGFRLMGPGPARFVVPAPLGPFPGAQVVGGPVRSLALVLLVVGAVGLGLLAVLRRSRWSGSRRGDRDGGSRAPSWN